MPNTIITAPPVTTCPSWCTTGHATDDELRVHVRPAGPLGVEVSALERNGKVEAATIYLPEVDDHGDLTPEQAATLGQQLLQAVRVLHGAPMTSV